MVKQRKIGAILRFLKIKIFLFFDFKKLKLFIACFVGQLKMANKNDEKIDDNHPKYRKLDGEQFGQIKKNWCNTEVSQNKDFLIF